MLEQVTLKNFFSFGEATTIDLNKGVNLLVGINGSGKSNFLKAIRLLHEAVAGQGFEKTFLQEWGGFSNVANVSGGHKGYIKLEFVFNYEYCTYNRIVYTVTIYPVGTTRYYFHELLHLENDEEKQILIDVHNNLGQIFLIKKGPPFYIGKFYREKFYREKFYREKFYGEKFYGEKFSYPSEKIPSVSPTELIIRQIDIGANLNGALRDAINEIITYNCFNTSSDSLIRQPSIFGTEDKLLPTGENLNTVIQKLKNEHSLDYEKIENLLRDINPNFKDITFNLFGSKSYLLLREKSLANAISIEHLSDGTLRYLLLLAIFYNPNRGVGICIDEPETGLHPDMINTIARAIKDAAKETQFFIATHSPLLLNAFELDDLLIFEKDEKNQTKVIYQSEDDFEEWNDNVLVGQLWLNGQLGGKRW